LRIQPGTQGIGVPEISQSPCRSSRVWMPSKQCIYVSFHPHRKRNA